jgi:hypothetical protein
MSTRGALLILGAIRMDWSKRAAAAKDYTDMLDLALEIRASEQASDEQRVLVDRVVNSVRKFMRASTDISENVARVRFFKLLDALGPADNQ